MFSIIIPIYNAAKSLKKCINSILTQTYQNFELLLIDDGSTDSSDTICDNYSEQDNRIKVFHQKNQGVGASRNTGLKNAKQEWIIFIDADDYVEKDYLQTIVNILNSQNQIIDAIIFPSFKEKPALRKIEPIDNIFQTSNIYNSKTVIEATVLFFQQSASIYSKVYKKSILKKYNVLFHDSCVFEDGMFNLMYFKNTNKVYYQNKAFYHYMIYTNQASLSRISLRPYAGYYNTAKELYPLIIETSSLKKIDSKTTKQALVICNRILSIGFYAIYKEHSNLKERKIFIEQYSRVFNFYSDYYTRKKYLIFKILTIKHIPFVFKDSIMSHLFKTKYKK